ncbi:hypothetical protein PRZ48_013597 [Zasmidium cellare]|uniref:Anhydro-N-acetylmuramic acid kinase n=1 Tax=Zasmidium cellare TaxID=395010 RepID=A0ABR0E2A8_ZASCE|nr:hypothetical protein PRZ48_013597 [Zasmidium cellare]
MADHESLSLRVIGTNQGTSMDGLDIVFVHFTQKSPKEPLHMKILQHGEMEFPRELKRKIMRLIKTNETSPEEMAVVNARLGEFAADAIHEFAVEHGFSVKDDVDLIGGQGQTIWHLPLPDLFPGRDVSRAHLDMGEISIIAANTGKTVVGNFRVSDMSLGRQGCPIFSALDSLLVNDPTKNRAVQNIGGIANFSISRAGDVEDHFDFDTGPGNVFIDAAVRYFTHGERQYDKDGQMGAQGNVDESIVREVLQQHYFTHDIPKTTGRETFGDTMAEDLCKRMTAVGASPEDCVATITRITAQSLVDHYRRYAPQPLHEIFMGGGGSYNPNIVNYLRQELPDTRLALIDEIGVPASAKEALGFALYTCEAFVGRPLMVPRRVESSRPGVIGHIQPGDNYFGLRRRVVRFWGDWDDGLVDATKQLVLVK